MGAGQLVHRRGLAGFWNDSIFNGPDNQIIEELEQVPIWVEHGATGARHSPASLLAWSCTSQPAAAGPSGPGVRADIPCSCNKWYFDELYNVIFVQPAFRLARLFWQVGDATMIDGVPNGLAELASDGSEQIVKIQTGSLAVYAFAMLIGVVVLVGIFMLSR